MILVVYVLGLGMVAAGFAQPTGRATPPLASITRAGLVGAAPLFLTAVTVHYANEYADVDTDAITNRTPFSGGSGALVRTGYPRRVLARATGGAALLAAATTAGLVLVVGVSPSALAILGGILVAGLAYSLPPVAFVRRGLGEAVNVGLGAFALPAYGVAVAGALTVDVLLATSPFALVVGCNLLATHWADREADARVGKRTLAVRWRPKRIRRVYVTLIVLAAATTVALGVTLVPPVVALAHLAAVPCLVYGAVVCTRQHSPLPSVAAMVTLAVSTTAAWWWLALAA